MLPDEKHKNQDREQSRSIPVPIAEKEITSKTMRANRSKDTKPELIVRQALWNAGIRGYRLHWNIPGKPDIAFPGRKIAIFINGCFWHRCAKCNRPIPKTHSDYWEEKFRRNRERDNRSLVTLEKQSWRTLVLWECEIKKTLEVCIAKVRSLLDDHKINSK